MVALDDLVFYFILFKKVGSFGVWRRIVTFVRTNAEFLMVALSVFRERFAPHMVMERRLRRWLRLQEGILSTVSWCFMIPERFAMVRLAGGHLQIKESTETCVFITNHEISSDTEYLMVEQFGTQCGKSWSF